MEKELNKMGDAKYMDLIGKYLSGNIQSAEKENLLKWAEKEKANQKFFDEMVQVWSLSKEYEEDFETDLDNAWAKIDQKTLNDPKPKQAKTINLSIRRAVLRVAAIGLLALTVGLWWYNHNANAPAELVVFETKSNEEKHIELPDGSEVWINENSTLSYDKTFTQRVVQLSGEAFFDVNSDPSRPFEITSGATKTTVLGTSFNIRAYPKEDEVEVAVEEGSVKLEENRNQKEIKSVLLEAGSSGIYKREDQILLKKENQHGLASSWKTKVIHFDDTPLIDIIEVLERYFKIEINTENPSILKCGQNYGPSVNPKLMDVIETFEFTMGLKLEKQTNGTYIFRGEADCD